MKLVISKNYVKVSGSKGRHIERPTPNNKRCATKEADITLFTETKQTVTLTPKPEYKFVVYFDPGGNDNVLA